MHVVLEANSKNDAEVPKMANVQREVVESAKEEYTKEVSKEVSTQTVVKTESSNENEVKDYDHIQKAPLVGTVYVANKPDEPPLVTVGQKIKKGDSICIIESMKMFNSIEADMDGVVEAVFIENGQVVEYGQDLVAISRV